jgi:magnesium-transporting ATPase (P-type)
MKNSYNWLKLTSFGLFLSFAILLISGTVLYVYPGGNGTGLMSGFGGLTKPAWLNQHIIFSLVFTLFALYHLFFINRTPFLSYLKKKKDGSALQNWWLPSS